ncbi:MAG: hypothetical protein EKK59_04510 [Neisseriaceae bacterium]|nr:MAG: hypothetical protein EKK59_04510 [Neisseriaceae bacterium]
MATYTGLQSGRAIHGTDCCGNTWRDSNQVTPPAALTTSDDLVLLSVPAGMRLETLRFRAGDFDTGTTLTANIGYRTRLPVGSATNLTYFAAASTALQASTLTAWQELVFAPVKFDEPVDIVLIPAANATGVSGTPSIYVQGEAAVVGIS